MNNKKLLLLFSLALISQINHAAIIFNGHTDNIESIVYSPDGNTLASASWDQTIRLWNTKTGKLNTVKIWDSQTGEIKQSLKHSGNALIAYSPTESILATVTEERIKLWEMGELIVDLQLANSINAIAFSVDGLAFARDNEIIQVLKTEIPSQLSKLAPKHQIVAPIVPSDTPRSKGTDEIQVSEKQWFI
ncbi:hypothetical protein PN36_25485 [Candidatus Thiomargarita nelsonii]|uniref:Uncharacterized protein n=1 Tax=Candidatus Thiomargarita nelsonii TaxID=1003181 RepID=A0A0A6P2Y2_9GAMM|nr:hypothetical protein PN36_25485 [Candidatus Thiomargarita nelsonii]